MDIGAGDIDLDDTDLIHGVYEGTAVGIFIDGKTADVGYDLLVENLRKGRKLFGDDCVDSRILEPDGIDEASAALGDSWSGISEARFSGGSFYGDGTEDVQIIDLCHLKAEPEGSAGRNDRIGKLEASKESSCVYHIISSLLKTGPSLQILFAPPVVRQVQPMHIPKPQPILSSRLSCAGADVAAQRAFIIGIGPQEKM